MNSPPVIIQATGVSAAAGSACRLDIAIKPGSVTCIVGPEPRLKSQWLKIIAGLEDFYAGRLLLQGKESTTMDRRTWQRSRQKIGYIGADTTLLSAQNIIDNIVTPALYHKLGSQHQLEEKAMELLDQAGYTELESLHMLPSSVESDKRYIAMLVRVLLLQPAALCIDKLFSKIGVMAKNHLYNLLREQITNNRLGVVLNTRNLDFAARYSNTLLFVSSTAVLKFTTFDDFRYSDDPQIKKFLKNYYSN